MDQIYSLQKVRFGIVGCGRIAQRHAEHANRLGVLSAVCDEVFERATDLGDRFNARAFSSFDELLKEAHEIDVVSICTPNGLHAQQTILAFQHGYHVICEKPMAIKVHDCYEMIKAAERANRRLFIVKQNRFNPPVAALKKLIDENRLGNILSVHMNCNWNRPNSYYRDWKGTLELDGGVLYTQFSHFIDLLYWIVGDVRNVHAFTSNAAHIGAIEYDDQGVAILEFYNGVLGSIHFTVNCYNKNMEGSITIFGEKGTIKIGGQYLNEVEYQNIEGYKIEGLPPGNPPNKYGEYVGSMSNHEKVYMNVINVLTNHGIIAANGIDGLKTVEIIEKIYRSAFNG